jgi:tripartite ATP-independent transporter DctM subunit
MVPPSIVLIIYGLIANVSISDIFTSSFVPGFMLASMYVAYVLVRAYTNPSVAPIASDQELDAPLREKLVAFKGVILPVLVAFMVLGSIYSGIASVTEASGLGVIGILISTWVRKELTFKLIKESTIRTLETVGMIIWIGIGASILVGVYNLMGGIRFIESLILSFGYGEPIYMLFLMMGILFILGMFLDWVGIALLTLPIFVPIINQIGYEPIWFGVVFSLNMQLSFLTPPFGPAAFYLKSVAPPKISLYPSDLKMTTAATNNSHNMLVSFINLRAVCSNPLSGCLISCSPSHCVKLHLAGIQWHLTKYNLTR